jgi:biopolymer transport protein TolR
MAIKTGKEHTTLSDINVTPFVDVVLVLLIIFMISAPMLKTGMDVQLPKAKASEEINAENAVVITIKRNGRISLNGKEVSKENLIKRVKEEMKEKKPLLIEADAKVYYEEVIDILNILKEEGFTEIGLITERE